MSTLILELPDEVARLIERTAEERDTTPSQVVSECASRLLTPEQPAEGKSFFALAKDKAARFRGPSDLTTNAKHLEGYGR